MKNIALLTLLVVLLSCSTQHSLEPQTADLPLTLSLIPALDAGFNVTRVRVTITKDDYINSLNLEIDGDTASGTFYGLLPGIYQISLEIYDGYTIIAIGSGEGEVIAGETTTVEITIIPQIGNLEIIIDWEDFIVEVPTRVLFIGNSITYWNDGIDLHTMNLALEAYPETETYCSSITGGGYTLEMHYNTESILQAIENGDWDLVVLQEQSTRPVNDPELFYEFATLFDELIVNSGAETVLFFSWNYRDNPEMLEDQSAAYNYIGIVLGVPVIPVGRAWQLSMEQNPLIVLYIADGVHASVKSSIK